MPTRSILLIITGSIAAYKALELIRLLKKSSYEMDVILTPGGQEFITPLSVSSLTGRKTYTELFSLTDEVEMGHIQLSRSHDLVVVAPATANILSDMVHGKAHDLPAATLLASNKPIMVAPAMNTQMWNNPATQRNLSQLREDGVTILAPGAGELACGETGDGRMAEPEAIFATIENFFAHASALNGLHAIVTAGPTQEPIDPVRYISNHSSGKQGYAIAAALAQAGAKVTLVSGPVTLPLPHPSITLQRVTTAQEMLAACEAALPADLFIATAAVADWRIAQPAATKIKKRDSGEPPVLALAENPDILKTISHHKKRPALVIGFAAETEKLEENARAKFGKKGCDWLLANDVSGGQIFGESDNSVLFFANAKDTPEPWHGSKAAIASRLVDAIIVRMQQKELKKNA
jgi:phosphopantothenoylcysteine decarboxylase / phosphopantothenate---cysteine ligase